MTGKSEEQLRKELRYFTERKRSFDQILTIIYELTWILGRVTVAYFILSLSVIGSYHVSAFYWRPVITLLVFVLSVTWILYGMDVYSVYKPILKDGSKGLDVIYIKTKCAVEAWRNTKCPNSKS